MYGSGGGSIWRLIRHGACDPFWNMAVDEAILLSFSSVPTIRFYTWRAAALSLGRFQRIDNSIDLDFCRSKSIAVVRRPTGGRGVLHGTDLTISIVKRSDGRAVGESYAELSRAVADALCEIGAPLGSFANGRRQRPIGDAANCFDLRARFELAVRGRKVFGCAQLRSGNAILQQNSLVLHSPDSDNLNAFPGGCREESDVCISEYGDGESITLAICRAVQRNFGISLTPAGLTEDEGRLAHQLARCKYGSEEWTLFGRESSLTLHSAG